MLRWQKAHGERGKWEWLDVDRLSERRANKFLLGGMIDYFQKSSTAWRKAREFAEEELGDRGNLWRSMVKIHPRTWSARSGPLQLHPHRKRHRKLQEMARFILEKYGGDARIIWRHQTPKTIQSRLQMMELGPALSRMAIGALKDHKFVKGKWDVKPDLNLNRILGRLTVGEALTPQQTLETTRKMTYRDPWRLDRPLFDVGRSLCSEKEPSCRFCPFAKDWCVYYSRNS